MMQDQTVLDNVKEHLSNALKGKDLTVTTVGEAKDAVASAMGWSAEELSTMWGTDGMRKLFATAVRAAASEPEEKARDETNAENTDPTDHEANKQPSTKQGKGETDEIMDTFSDDAAPIKRRRIQTHDDQVAVPGTNNDRNDDTNNDRNDETINDTNNETHDGTGWEFSSQENDKKNFLVSIVADCFEPELLRNLPATGPAQYLEALEKRIITEGKEVGLMDEDRLPTSQEVKAFMKRKELVSDMGRVDVKNIVSGTRVRTVPEATLKGDGNEAEQSPDAEDEQDDDFVDSADDDDDEDEDDYSDDDAAGDDNDSQGDDGEESDPAEEGTAAPDGPPKTTP